MRAECPDRNHRRGETNTTQHRHNTERDTTAGESVAGGGRECASALGARNERPSGDDASSGRGRNIVVFLGVGCSSAMSLDDDLRHTCLQPRRK